MAGDRPVVTDRPAFSRVLLKRLAEFMESNRNPLTQSARLPFARSSAALEPKEHRRVLRRREIPATPKKQGVDPPSDGHRLLRNREYTAGLLYQKDYSTFA